MAPVIPVSSSIVKALREEGGDVIGSQERHNGGNTYAVICAKGGAIGFHPVAVDQHFDAFFVEVEIRFAVFLMDHIQVAL